MDAIGRSGTGLIGCHGRDTFDFHFLTPIAGQHSHIVGQGAHLAVTTLLALVAWRVPPLDFLIECALTGHPTLLKIERIN